MITLNEYLINKGNKHLVTTPAEIEYHYFPKSHSELAVLVDKLLRARGIYADLNDIDTSKITDMHELFDGYWFNGDISQWDVSKVTDMHAMFRHTQFNGDISDWNVKNVENMSCMFAMSEFNGDISDWNVSKVKDMSNMFEYSDFSGEKGDISNWKVSKKANLICIFNKCPLENNPPKWYKNK